MPITKAFNRIMISSRLTGDPPSLSLKRLLKPSHLNGIQYSSYLVLFILFCFILFYFFKTRHPDKNPGCKECADKFVRITDAYKQLMDYDRGTLRLVNQPGAAPPKKEEGKRDSGPKTTSTKKHKA